MPEELNWIISGAGWGWYRCQCFHEVKRLKYFLNSWIQFCITLFTGACRKSSPCMEMSACFLVAYLGKESQQLAGEEKFRSSHGRKIKTRSSHGNHIWAGFFPFIAKKKIVLGSLLLGEISPGTTVCGLTFLEHQSSLRDNEPQVSWSWVAE